MLTQEEICTLMVPLIKEKGILYEKFLPIIARAAEDGEKIQTYTSDGLETVNFAKKGDFIVQNQTEAGEAYIMDSKKFADRYVLMESLDNGLARYKPIGKIWAVEMSKNLAKTLSLTLPFHFIASWGAPMIVKEKDFLVSSSEFSSVYRIARKEFFETYRLSE